MLNIFSSTNTKVKIGITGGIGSGKSTVSQLFELLGIPVYIADTESKRLTESSPKIREELINVFGTELYEGHKLNKSLLASYIFNDKQKLEIVNSIIHPVVFDDFAKWIEKHSDTAIIATESAILFEAGMNQFTDKVIVVYTPVEERIRRTMLRDGLSREKVVERIKSQLSDEEKVTKADFVIYNDESKSLIKQISEIIEQIK